MASKTEWHQDNFLVSTSKALLQPSAINAAFGTDHIYWARPLEESLLKKMLNQSLCFGIYQLGSPCSEGEGSSNPQQIGLARLITDEVTFAYLTDVYILQQYQEKGLGSFLINCVNESLSSWPELRGAFLITTGLQDFYAKRLEMIPFDGAKEGMQWMVKRGPAYSLSD